MSQDDVFTLIGLARKYPEATDALLAAAERIGKNGAGSTRIDARERSDAPIQFPIEVFRKYKGHTYHGMLSRSRAVILNGTEYNKPSTAAMSITKTQVNVKKNQVNGWTWWHYVDPATGKERTIDHLRQAGLI